jgi:hypothetical protein
MRVVKTCNFGKSGEAPGRDESFVAEGVRMDSFLAEKLCAAMCGQFSGESSPWYYKVVADDYKLQEFEP